MLKNYFIVALRNIANYKAYSLINIFGFSIALVPLLLAVIYINNEFSFDKNNDKFQRIVRVIRDDSPIVPNPLAAALKAEMPEVEYAARIASTSEVLSYKEKRFLEKDILFADVDFFKIFTFVFIRGNPNSALSDEHSIVISQSMAKKYFGDGNPIGNIITARGYLDLRVTGVYKDLPNNSHFQANFVLPASILDGSTTIGGIQTSPNSWGISMFYTYLLLRENSDRASISSRFHQIIARHSGREDLYTKSTFSLQSLTDIHLYSHFRTELKENGSSSRILLCASLAIIILIITTINYVNLSTAQSSRRTKEIAIRKIVGANTGQLIVQLLTETVVITFLALALSIFLVHLVLPYFNTFVERKIEFNPLVDVNLTALILSLMCIFTVCTGAYPALLLASIHPLSFLSGKMGALTSTVFRRILVAIQFIVSISLVFSAILVREQNTYISKKDLGYVRDNIVIFYLRRGEFPAQMARLKNELETNTNVISISTSTNLPNNSAIQGGVSWPGKTSQARFEMEFNYIDEDFVSLYGMRVVDGRNFSREYPSDDLNSVLISESAVRKIGWDNPIGKSITFGSPNGVSNRTVIGVVNDFHIHTLYKTISPFCMVMDPDIKHYYLSVKIDPHKQAETIDFLKTTMKTFQPEYATNVRYFSDIIDSSYKTESRLEEIISAFSVLTILIACLGLFGLISFITEVRQREIAIRKVLGATSFQIGAAFVREMISLIILSSVLAIPISLYVIQKWLSNFAYQTEIDLRKLVFTALLIYAMSIIVVFYQVHKASIKNPVDALKHE